MLKKNRLSFEIVVGGPKVITENRNSFLFFYFYFFYNSIKIKKEIKYHAGPDRRLDS